MPRPAPEGSRDPIGKGPRSNTGMLIFALALAASLVAGIAYSIGSTL